MFANDNQIARFCSVLLGPHLGHLFDDRGPTDEAVKLYKRDGGPMSSGERVLLLTAMAVWNSIHNRKATVADLMLLDSENLSRVAQGLLAIAWGAEEEFIVGRGASPAGARP